MVKPFAMGRPVCSKCVNNWGFQASQTCCNGHFICEVCVYLHSEQIEGQLRCPYPGCNGIVKSSGSTGSTLDQLSPTPSTSQTPAPSGFRVSYKSAAALAAPPSAEQGGNLQKIITAKRSQQQAQESADVLKVVQSYCQALSRTLQKREEVGERVRRPPQSTISELKNAEKLATYFGNVSRQGGVDDIQWKRELERAYKCDEKLVEVQRGLNMLNLESGSVRVDLRAAGVNGGSETTLTATLDLAAEASRRPEVLAAIQYLLFLLNKQDEQDIQDTEGGVSDLEQSDVGSAGLGGMEAEKREMLNSAQLSDSLNLDCSMDPHSCNSQIEEHAASLMKLVLHNVQDEQLTLLRDHSLPKLKQLEIRNWKGILSNDEWPTKRGRADKLQTIYLCLPFKIQLNMWKAFAPSLVNVTLSVDVQSNLDVHRSIGPLATKTPNLKTIHLTRKKREEHTEDGCERQTAAIKNEVDDIRIRVTCNMCGNTNSGVAQSQRARNFDFGRILTGDYGIGKKIE